MYVANNPVNFNDPTGRIPSSPQGWKDLGMASLGMASNGLGVVVAGTGTVVSGTAAVVSPEPLTKVGAAASTIFLAGMTTKRAYGIYTNGQNFVDAWNGGTPSMPSSAATAIANSIAPGATNVSLALQGLDLATDLAVGKVPIGKIRVSKAFSGGGSMTIKPNMQWSNYQDYANFKTPLWDQMAQTPKYADYFMGASALSTGLSNSDAISSGFSDLGRAANGGFVLYPSRPNTNMIRSVYKK